MRRQCVHGEYGTIELLSRDGVGGATLFLHGIGSTAASWDDLIRRLPGRCVAWNAPGYGASTPLGGTAGLHQYVDALDAAMRTLGEDPIHVVGHSWGTLLAASLASNFPQRVRSLALLNPTPGYASMSAAQQHALLCERLGKIRDMGPDGLARSAASSLISPSATPLLLKVVQELGTDITEQGMCDAVRMLIAADLLQILDRLVEMPMPMLVLTGDEDRITGSDLASSILCRFPMATSISLARCGHLAPLEAPERTAAALESLWSSCT